MTAARRTSLGVSVRVARARELLRKGLERRALVRTALTVRRRTGKTLSSQAREVAALWSGPGRLGPKRYYAYGLFDDERYSAKQKREYVGWRRESFARKLNSPEWRAICDDKLVSYALFRGLGLPHPEMYAVYQSGGRTFGRVPTLETPEAMADFLRFQMPYPFFGKPVSGTFGQGASSVDGIDHERDALLLADGTAISVERYVSAFPVSRSADGRLPADRPAGYLFQERVVQHPDVNKVSGGRVSSLRLVVLLRSDGPQLFRATWMLPVSSNITDHVAGASGNIKCSVDLETGQVERAVQGRISDDLEVYALGEYGEQVEHHPDTRATLPGVRLPYWHKTVGLCLHAAATLPGLRYQSWDVVMGVEGPLLLEVNYQGVILQVPGGGFNTPELRRLLST